MEEIIKNQKKDSVLLVIIKIIIAGLSFWALADNPYGYYQFLRVAIFIVGIILAYRAYDQKQEINIWVVLYVLTAILFNPLVPIYMAKDSWAFFNIATGLFYLVSLGEKQKKG